MPDYADDFDRAVARLEDRVARTIRQCERFDTVAERITQWAEWWGEDAIARWLENPETDRQRREQAMAALALKATVDAGHLLARYEPRDSDEVLFHQVCRIEWERRYEATSADDALDEAIDEPRGRRRRAA